MTKIKFLRQIAVSGFLAICMMGGTAVEADAQTKRALLIGISDYGNVDEDPDCWANISGANDVRLLTPLLQQQEFEVSALVDAQATHQGILAALNKMVQESRPGDLVYLHFSMHGQPFEDQNGDEADGWDEALIPVDAQMYYVAGKYEGQHHLLDDELESYFSKIRQAIGPSGHLFVSLDACHSGTSSRGDNDHVRGVREGFTHSGKSYTPDRTKETNGYFSVPTAPGESPVTFLEACRSYQVNKEILDYPTKTWYGSLSYYISKAMDTHAIDSTGQWIEVVKIGMTGDRRVRKQNMVIETSK